MFIRKIKNSKGTTYLHLVESYREGKKVKHRTLLPLGKAGDGQLENLTEAIARHQNLLTATELAKSISVEKTFILGPLLILKKLFEKLGIDKAIENILKLHPKISFDVQKALFTMVASRFVNPGSKLKIFEHWQKSFYPEMLEGNLKLHQIYRALDLLSGHKEDIEKDLYWHGRDGLFNRQVDVVLYDLTTLRFESTRTDLGELRQFGYSKEMRKDCTQVMLGLMVDTDGIPLGFEVYPGNTFEGHTVSDIVKKLKKKFAVRRFIFVGDRGLFSKDQLEEIKKEGEEYIVGMKLGLFKKREGEFYNLDKYEEVAEGFKIHETKHEEDRLILTWSKKRKERAENVREDILSKLKNKLKSKKTKSFVTNTNYKKYVSIPEGKDPVLNEKAIEQESKKDGFFGVVTNVKDMTAEGLISQYRGLWKVEDAFGEIKGNLKARPIFHWTDKRITGHLMMCFISYLCEAHLTKALRGKKISLKSPSIESKNIKERPLTVVEAMKELREVRAIPVEVKSHTVWVRTDITGNAASLFKAAGVNIPKKFLKVSKQATSL